MGTYKKIWFMLFIVVILKISFFSPLTKKLLTMKNQRYFGTNRSICLQINRVFLDKGPMGKEALNINKNLTCVNNCYKIKRKSILAIHVKSLS